MVARETTEVRSSRVRPPRVSLPRRVASAHGSSRTTDRHRAARLCFSLTPPLLPPPRGRRPNPNRRFAATNTRSRAAAPRAPFTAHNRPTAPLARHPSPASLRAFQKASAQHLRVTLPLDDVDRERVGDPSPPRSPRASRRRLDMTATAAAAAATVTGLASGSSGSGSDTRSRHGSRPGAWTPDGGFDIAHDNRATNGQSEFRERCGASRCACAPWHTPMSACPSSVGAVEIEGAAVVRPPRAARDFRQLATRLKSQEERRGRDQRSREHSRRRRALRESGGRAQQTPKISYARPVSLAESRARRRLAGGDARGFEISTRAHRGGEWRRTAGRGGKSTKPAGSHGGDERRRRRKKHRGGRNAGGKGGGKGDGRARDVVVGSSDRAASTRSLSFRRSFTDPSTDLASGGRGGEREPPTDRATAKYRGVANPNANPLAGRPPRATSTSTSATRNAVVSDTAKRARGVARERRRRRDARARILSLLVGGRRRGRQRASHAHEGREGRHRRRLEGRHRRGSTRDANWGDVGAPGSPEGCRVSGLHSTSRTRCTPN